MKNIGDPQNIKHQVSGSTLQANYARKPQNWSSEYDKNVIPFGFIDTG
jgi:hypothetical protein